MVRGVSIATTEEWEKKAVKLSPPVHELLATKSLGPLRHERYEQLRVVSFFPADRVLHAFSAPCNGANESREQDEGPQRPSLPHPGRFGMRKMGKTTAILAKSQQGKPHQAGIVGTDG
jgi:hypothetical protein